VRSAVERVCGAAVTGARTQPGGFSPGVAARVRCADGSRWFVKAASAELNPDTPVLHCREAKVLAGLDPMIAAGRLPVPRLRGTAEVGPWFALVIDDVAGRQPTLPWREDELALAGYFTERSLRPPPPGLPTVRRFQAAQAEVALRWLATLL
jgi:hypothetical protein